MGTGSAGDRLLQSRRFFDFAPVGLAVVGAAGREHGRILDANPAFADLVSVAPGSLTGTAVCELLHAEERALGAEQLTRLIAGTTPRLEGDMRLIRADGETRWVRVHACLLHNETGRPEAVLVHVSDLTRMRRAATRQEEITRRLSEAQELARVGSFEWLPETDEVLISDEVFRLFGLRPGSRPGTLSAWEPSLDRSDLPGLMDAVAAALAAGSPQSFEFRFKTAAGALRWAEGRVTAERDGTRVTRLRGTIQDINERKLGEDKLRHQVEELAEVQRLRAAICEGRLRLYGQEIVEVKTRESVMHELLVRLAGPDGEIIPAAQFLSLAERHGVIKEIDRWVLGQAVELARAGRRVALNVSARTMSDPRYAEAVVQMLADRDAEPALITFEITETALVENFDQARAFAHEVGALGCTVALDDFGTGYGTLTYLKQLPAHYLKLDREFVADAVLNPRSRAVIKGIVTLAQSFGQRTVAEGVEDHETLELLGELGVDYAQGFFVGHPAPVAERSAVNRR